MHADAAVLAGSRHAAVAAPCQDYSLGTALGEHRAAAIVADGCSTGGHTDLGARAWSLAALAALRDAEGILGTADLQRAVVERAAPLLAPLAFEDAYATLAVLQAHGTRVEATFWGDGALLARHADGRMTLVQLHYADNAPAYLNYQRRPGAQATWSAGHAGQELAITTHRCDADGTVLAVQTETQPAAAGPWQWQGHAGHDELQVVLLATDGIASRSVDVVATARELLAFKAPAGEFLRRRLGRQARAWQAAGSWPADDLAAAGIWLGG